MATKWQSESTRDAIRIHRCHDCKEGRHQPAVLGERATHSDPGGPCECHCTKLNVLPIEAPIEMKFRADMPGVLRLLRERGVQCRGSRSSNKLLWLPKPDAMEPAVRMAIRSHKLELVHILFPWADHNVPLRPFWFKGEAGPCIDEWCVEERVVSWCQTYDPLGQRRHANCGWLTAPPPGVQA